MQTSLHASDGDRCANRFRPSRRAVLHALTSIACLAPCSALAVEPIPRSRCAAVPVRLPARGFLRRTAARLRARMPVQVLAIGSSSTQGVGASSPAAAYPARLEIALEQRFPGANVEVINAGKAGETADGALARLNAELDRIKPDLVVWQVGTNDALSASVSEPKFEAVVERGILSIERHKSDVLLVDPQFTKTVRDPDRYERFVQTLERVAEKEHICLFSRYHLMKTLAASSDGGVEPLLAPDGLHMNDAGYACIADRLAGQIQDLVTRPDL
jgi:acyl-CoA thioesterase-1